MPSLLGTSATSVADFWLLSFDLHCGIYVYNVGYVICIHNVDFLLLNLNVENNINNH